MPTKAPARKIKTTARKPVKKTVKKRAKKVTWDEILKAQEETWKAIRETHDSIFGLKNAFDSFIERIYTSALPKKLKQLGFSFERTVTYRSTESIYAEIDAMLENQTQAMVVIIEHTLCIADIDNHLLRMDKLRKYADEHDDKRQFMGAMAATITDESTRNYALNKGLFVIEPRGEDFKVIKPSVEPRVW